MNPLREYIINFGRLKTGKHEFQFAIGKEFFDQFEYSLVKDGDLVLDLLLEKQNESFFILNFQLKGSIVLECDRCLDPFPYQVDSTQRILVKLKEAEQDGGDGGDDELIFLPLGSYEYDLSPVLYEFVNLQIPLRRICEQGGKECNQAMLDYIQRVNESKDKDAIDPRWEGLKNFNNKDKK